MRNTRFRRSSLAFAAALSGALALSACSSSDEPETQQSQTEQSTVEESPTQQAPTDEPTDDSTETDEASAAPAGDQAEVEIGETIEDPDMGDTIQVVSAIRDFPSEEKSDVIADGGEVVLLQVTVTPGTEYGGLVSIGDFEISWDDGADFWNNQTRMIEDEMEAAGYTPLEDVSRRDGGEHTGWIAFFPEERSDSYLIQYQHGGAEVIGSDEQIDPFETQFEIPAP